MNKHIPIRNLIIVWGNCINISYFTVGLSLCLGSFIGKIIGFKKNMLRTDLHRCTSVNTLNPALFTISSQKSFWYMFDNSYNLQNYLLN